MTSVGDYLKKEREARNLNLGEVAELTKISARYLACIENGDYDQLPPGPYAKGYIAAYARQVCGDESQALELYARTRPAARQTTMGTVVNGDAPEEGRGTRANGDGASKQGPNTAGGFNITRALRRALPEGGNLRHLSGRASEERVSIGARVMALTAPLAKLTNKFKRLPKGALLKGALLAAVSLSCLFVLALAGVGAYHLWFSNPPSHPAVQAESPPAATPDSKRAGGDRAAPVRPQKTSPPEKSEPAEEVAEVRALPPSAGAGEGPAADRVQAAGASAVPAGSKPPRVNTADRAPALASGGGQTRPAPPHRRSASDEVPIKKRPPQLKPKPVEAPAMAARPLEGHAEASASDAAPEQGAVADIPLRLMKASVCTAIEERMPVGVGERFPWTTAKIFVWSLLGATDPPAKVRHIYYHGDTVVSDVTLKVGSSHWRTWSFHTLSGQLHIGPWHVDIATIDGRVLRRLHFSIE